MDFFSNLFGVLFGKKKKPEEQQPTMRPTAELNKFGQPISVMKPATGQVTNPTLSTPLTTPRIAQAPMRHVAGGFTELNKFSQPISVYKEPEHIKRAKDQLNTQVVDFNDYYKQDADKLRKELDKGAGDNQQYVEGLTQSLKNRQGELESGAYARDLQVKKLGDEARRQNRQEKGRENMARRSGSMDVYNRQKAQEEERRKQLNAKRVAETQKKWDEKKKPLLDSIEQSLAVAEQNDLGGNSQELKKRATELKRKLAYVGDIDDERYATHLYKDIEDYAKLSGRISDAYDLTNKVYQKTGDANKARETLDRSLKYSAKQSASENEWRKTDAQAATIAYLSQPIRSLARAGTTYLPNMVTGLVEAGANLVGAGDLDEGARKTREMINKPFEFKTDHDNQALDSIFSGVGNLGMDIATGSIIAKTAMASKVATGAVQTTDKLSKGGKVAQTLGKGVMSAVGTTQAVGTTGVTMLKHFPQNFNEVYNDAREHGVGHWESVGLGLANATLNTAIEKVNLDAGKWLKSDGVIVNALTSAQRMFGEGMEEWAQSMVTSAVNSIYRDVDWEEALAQANEAGAMGLVVGWMGDLSMRGIAKAEAMVNRNIDSKIDPKANPTLNAVIKARTKQEIGRVVGEVNQVLEQSEDVKYLLNKDQVVDRKQDDFVNDDDIVVNEKTGETLGQSVSKLQGYGWSEKDINAFREAVIAKNQGVEVGQKTLDEKITPYDYDSSGPVYHGTSHEVAPNIRQEGLLAGSELPANAYRGGGYGELQNSISVTPDYEVAKNFALLDGRKGVVVETKTRNDINVVEVEGISYAEDLNDYIPELKKRGVDAVWIDGENELAVINKDILSNDLKIEGLDGVRYELVKNKTSRSFQEQELRRVLGDSYEVVTNRNRLDNKSHSAQGYADLRNQVVAVLDGKMTTGYHEAGHVAMHALNQADPELAGRVLNSIVEQYGAEALVNQANENGYAQALGRDLDINNQADVLYAAEEQLMNNLAKYAEAKAKGRENYYARQNNLSARVKAWFDRAIAYLKDMVGRLDVAHDFMYRFERGDFAPMIDQMVAEQRGELSGNIGQLSPQMMYKVHNTPAGKLVEIEGDPLRGVPIQQIPAKVRQVIKERFQGNEYSIGDTDQTARVTARSKNELAYRQQKMSEQQYAKKGTMTYQLDELVTSMDNLRTAPNRKNISKPNVKSYTYGTVTVKMGDQFYDADVNIENYKDGNRIIYDISNIKKTTPERINLLMEGVVYADSLSQDNINVNNDSYDISKIKESPWSGASTFSQNRLLQDDYDSSLAQNGDDVKMKLSGADVRKELKYQELRRRKLASPKLQNALWDFRKAVQDVNEASGQDDFNSALWGRIETTGARLIEASDGKVGASEDSFGVLDGSIDEQFWNGKIEIEDYLKQVKELESQRVLKGQSSLSEFSQELEAEEYNKIAREQEEAFARAEQQEHQKAKENVFGDDSDFRRKVFKDSKVDEYNQLARQQEEAIARTEQQKHQEAVDDAFGNNPEIVNEIFRGDQTNEYNQLTNRQNEAVAWHEQGKHQEAVKNILGDDSKLRDKILKTSVRPEHQKVMEYATVEALELYNDKIRDLKRIGRNLNHSESTANSEDITKFKKEYNQKLNEIERFVKDEAKAQNIRGMERLVLKKVPEWQAKVADGGNMFMFKELDQLLYKELSEPLNSYAEMTGQIQRLTGMSLQDAMSYLDKQIQTVGSEVEGDTILNGFYIEDSGDPKVKEIVEKARKGDYRFSRADAKKIFTDNEIRIMAIKASQDGTALQLIYRNDAQTGATEMIQEEVLDENGKRTGKYQPLQFDPDNHYIANGSVFEKHNNRLLGNLVQIEPTSTGSPGGAIRVWTGRQYETYAPGLFSSLRDVNNTKFNTAMLLEQVANGNADNLSVLNSTLIENVRKARAEKDAYLRDLAKDIDESSKNLNRSVSWRHRDELNRYLVFWTEPPRYQEVKLPDGKTEMRPVDKDKFRAELKSEIVSKFGERAFEQMVESQKLIRTKYDELFKAENDARLAVGMPLIEYRQDYLTHLAELADVDEQGEQIHDNLAGNAMRDVLGTKQRGKIPTLRQGLTHNTRARRKWAGYDNKRYLDNKPNNAFDALRHYAKTSSYNAFMIDPIAQIRSFETAIKAWHQAFEMPAESVMGSVLEKPAGYNSEALSDFTAWVQEHANIVAGKSSSADRELLASSDGRKKLNAYRKIQSIVGLSKIAGNVSTFVMQPVNQVVVIGEMAKDKQGARAYMKATKTMLSIPTANRNPIHSKSNFIKSRYTDATGIDLKTSFGAKAIDAMGKTVNWLGGLEHMSTLHGWYAFYHRARANGKTEAQAILEADHVASKVLTGRGVGEGAHKYNSARTAMLQQFTRETNDIWNLITQKEKNGGWGKRQILMMLLASAGANELIKQLRGSKATADPVGELIKTASEISKGEDLLQTLVSGGQAVAGEIANMSPEAQVVLAMLPDRTRKQIFGENSEMGRYGVSPAGTSVVSDVANTIDHLINERYNKAGQTAISLLPYGNQIRKSWEANEAINQGYTANYSGNIQTEVEDGFWNRLLGTAFGKSALREQKEFNNAGHRALSKDQSDLVRQMKQSDPEVAEMLFGEYRRRQSKTSNSGDSLSKQERIKNDLFRAQMGDDYYIYKLSKTKRMTAVKNGELTMEYLDAVDERANKLRKELDLEVKDDGRRLYEKPEAEYEEALADHEWKLKRGEYTRKGKIEATKKLQELEAGKSFAKETRDLYELSKDDFRTLVTTANDGKKVLDEVLAYGDALVKAGVIETNKFRDKYGNVNLGAKKSGGASGRRASSSVPSIYRVSTSDLLKGLANAKASGKFRTVKGYNIARGRTGRKVGRLNGGRTILQGKRVA